MKYWAYSDFMLTDVIILNVGSELILENKTSRWAEQLS